MDPLVSRVLNYLEQERHVILRAPVVLALIASIVGGIVWYITSAHDEAFYEETIRTTEQRRAYAQERLEEAERKIVSLEKQGGLKGNASASLRIAEEEKVAIAKELRESGSFSTVILRLPDSNSSSVADFLWILRKAEWQVNGTVTVVEDKPMVGLFILVSESGGRPVGADILARVFKKHNVDCVIRPDPEQGLGSFALFVGSNS